ncbi:hypothetical protein DV738_g4179, partial [Chaetothyriales sp. CBS 135597]
MSTNDLQALFANIRPRSRDPSTNPSAVSTTPSIPPSSAPAVNSVPIAHDHAAHAAPSSLGQSSSQPQVNNPAKSLLDLLNFSSSASSHASLNNTQPDQSQSNFNVTQPDNGPAPSNSNPKANTSRIVSASNLVAELVNSSAGSAKPAAELTPPSEDRATGDPRSRPPADTPQDALLKLLSKSKSTSASRAASNESRSAVLSGTDSPKPSSQAPSKVVAQTDLPPKPDFTYTHSVEPLSTPLQQTPKANPPLPESPRSPIFKSFGSDPQPGIETPQSLPQSESPADQLSHRRLKLTPRSAFARAERLTREISAKSPSRKGPTLTAENPTQPASDISAQAGGILTEELPKDATLPSPSQIPVEAAKEDTTTEGQTQNGNHAQPSADTPPPAGKEDLPIGKLPPDQDMTVPLPGDTPPDAASGDGLLPVTPSEQAQAGSRSRGESKDNLQSAADEWEDAEDELPQEDDEHRVPVFNFPIRPFVSITLRLSNLSGVDIRPEGVMEISRLKKDFDQLDRSLAAATSKYIGYALTKNGGMRVIRQDDGNDHHVFKNSHDRIFNVSFCTTSPNFPPAEQQAILGTGVSGSVYYATLSKDGSDLFENNELDAESLIFPPWPPAYESGPSAVLKTRARRSSRHPEYFAIGRGKSIHLIWPSTVLNPAYGITDESRVVDLGKLYQERNVQISIGKAGKDFVFSDDDSVIASLDKTGRLRFWDIRELTKETFATGAQVSPVKIDVPLLSLLTAPSTEKSWPTSVLFVDKIRPYSKGVALRYVLIGLRQNHTLQLWDLALGKAVQELNFPHDSETDGICSVCYHPNSCVIVVGHPTRNSIFFIHLSAPRHTLSSSLSQASYIQRIAAKDPELPRPDSTACMSGISEMSFASKGQLRSVELLPVHRAPDAPKPTDNKAPLFELYVAHSKGVTCLTITKEDLGWDIGNKPIHGVDAQKEGLVEIRELQQAVLTEESTLSRSPPAEAPIVPTTASSSKKKKSKKTTLASEVIGTSQPEHEPAVASQQPQTSANGSAAPAQSTTNDIGVPKESKKPSKKTPTHTIPLSRTESSSQNTFPAQAVRQESPQGAVDQDGTVGSNLHSTADASSTTIVAPTNPEKVSVGISGAWLDKETEKIKEAISKEFKREMSSLRANIQQDRVVLDTSASARQEAVMRLVSQTLANNVERTLGDIVSAQIQQTVLPAVSTVTARAIRDEVRGQVGRALHDVVPRELASQLPASVKSALLSPQLSQSLSDGVAVKVTKQIETQMGDIIKRHIVPNFERLSATAAQRAVGEAVSQVQAELARFEEHRRRDSARIEQLNSMISGMAEALQSMSRAQVAFQEQLLATSGPVSTVQLNRSAETSARPSSVKPLTQEEIELNEIADLMNQGKYEDGSIRWLHSTQQVELFDNLFVRYTPDYLSTDVTPLVAFSIAVTVAKSLSTNTAARLEWILAAFDSVDLNDPEIADLSEYGPALLTSLIQKLESLYMTIAEEDSNNPVLKQIPSTAKKAKEMRSALARGSEGLSAEAAAYLSPS